MTDKTAGFGAEPHVVEGNAKPAPPRSSLPSRAQLVEALADLEQVWNRLVPRSSRPAHKGLYERLRRQLSRVLQHVEALGAPDDVEDDEDDEASVVKIMQVVRSLNPEQWEMVQILMRFRNLTDVGRAEAFHELGESHCTDCGQELDPEDPHENCPEAEDDEIEIDEGEIENTPGSGKNVGGALPAVIPLPLSPKSS